MSSALIDTHSLSSIKETSLLLSHVRTIVKFYIWPLLVLFGLTGNCLSILVLTRRRLIRTSTNNYLTILAVFDSCYLIVTLLLNISSHPKFSHYAFTDTFLYIFRPFADFSSNAATWLIVCFTLERTLAVTKPIYAKRTCSVRRSRHLISALLIICLLITIPRFFERGLVRENFNALNRTGTSNISKREKFLLKLHGLYLVFICIVIIWIPLLVLCICNSILIWHVRRSRHFDDDLPSTNIYESHPNSTNSINKLEFTAQNHPRASLASSMSLNTTNPFHLRRHSRSVMQKRRVTIILIVCLFVALLLWTPQSLSLTYETLIQSYSEMSNKHRITLLIFNNLANLFVCINASIDFILYCFLSERFARTCKQIICRQCTNPNQINGQRQRLASIDRTSFLLPNPTHNLHQQQLAANTTNKYYIQLYNFYQNSSGYKERSNKNWKKTFARSMTTDARSDKHIFYQQNLPRNKSNPDADRKSTNVLSNPVLDFTDENKEFNGSVNTSVTNSSKPSRSGTVTNV